MKQFEQFNQGFCSQAMEDLRCFASRGRAIGLLEVCQAERGGRSLAPLASLQTRRQDCYMNVKRWQLFVRLKTVGEILKG